MSSYSARGSVDDGQNRKSGRAWPLGRTRWAIAGVMLGVLGSSVVRVGHLWPSTSGATVEATDETDGTIDGAVRRVTRSIEDVSTTVRGRYDRALVAANNDALVAQVIARLREDKSLDAEQIDVFVENKGTVILKGQVRDEVSKNLAVDLTRDIRGVVNVEDHLAIPPRGRVIAAASDEDPNTDVKPRRTR